MSKDTIQLALFVPKPGQRPPGWITYRDRVLVIHFGENPKRPVEIRAGYITSWPGSHGSGFEVDNVRKTIVWLYNSHCMAGSADDEHEMSFNPQDPHLLKIDEVDRIRKDFEFAIEYFGDSFPADMVRIIVDTLAVYNIYESTSEAELRELRKEFEKQASSTEGVSDQKNDSPSTSQRKKKSWWLRSVSDNARNACAT